MLKKFVRNVGKGTKYDDDELVIIKKVHECFSHTISSDLPKELQLSEDGVTPFHTVGPTDFIKSFWVGKLKQSLLTTEVGEMIGDITDYMAKRATLGRTARGNPNDPWNLVCYEFLNWLSRDLSGATCNKDTLAMVRKRCQYIIKLNDADTFATGSDDTSTKKTMLNVLISVQTTLQERIIPIIEKEIANTRVRGNIAELRIHGESVLCYGFQYLFYALRKTSRTFSPNINQLAQNILNTRSGKLLGVLLKTPCYAKIFELGQPSQTTPPNPFTNANNQPCIPTELLAELSQCTEIPHYLHKNARGLPAKKTGILEVFCEDHDLLIKFIRMHATLVEFGRALLSCYDAYSAAGRGGDILVYGHSQKIVIDLMGNIEKLCSSLNALQDEISKKAETQRGVFNKKAFGTRKTKEKNWDKNYDKIFSITTQLKEAITSCSAQADFVKKEAVKVPIDERIKVALERTMHFTQTATLLSTHIGNFLSNESNPLDQRSAPPLSISPRHSTAPAFGSSQELGRSPRLISGSPPPRSRSNTFFASMPLLEYLAEPTELTTVQPDPNTVSDKSIKFLLALVDDTPELIKLKLSNQSLTGNGAAPLWKKLMKRKTLVKLVLSNNTKIFYASFTAGREGAHNNQEAVGNFADVLPLQTNLKSLCIAGCNLDEMSVSCIANRLTQLPTLEVLDVSNNPIRDDGIKFICDALKKTETSEEGEKELCPRIKELRIVNCGLTDVGAKHLLALLKDKPRITDILILLPDDLETRPVYSNTPSYANDFSQAIVQELAAQIHENNQKCDAKTNAFGNGY